MPKFLFYVGTAFCLFLALSSATEAGHELQSGTVAFVAVRGAGVSTSGVMISAVLLTLLAGIAAAAIFVRMAALLAARNLFGALLATATVTATVAALGGVLLLQIRMESLARRAPAGAASLLRGLSDVHFAGVMLLGYFVSLSLLALRPYFAVQASRILSALVFLPLPVFLLVGTDEALFQSASGPLPATSPALRSWFMILAVLFFAIAVHCIRHRHMFLEMTNLRELLEPRVDPSLRTPGRPIRLGGAAFDS